MSEPRWYRKRSRLLTVLVLTQAIVLIGISLSFYAVGWFGKEIRLQTVPIDPRDLMYGDYVILKYDINQINTSLWKGPGAIYKDSKTLYVVIKPNDTSAKKTYEAIGIYDQKPAVHGEEVALRATFDYRDDSYIHVKYGLETYYVAENTGKLLEDQAGTVVSKVKVAPWGRAVLEGIE
jgi:uncharacterized membrane-anchored protein